MLDVHGTITARSELNQQLKRFFALCHGEFQGKAFGKFELELCLVTPKFRVSGQDASIFLILPVVEV